MWRAATEEDLELARTAIAVAGVRKVAVEVLSVEPTLKHDAVATDRARDIENQTNAIV